MVFAKLLRYFVTVSAQCTAGHTNNLGICMAYVVRNRVSDYTDYNGSAMSLSALAAWNSLPRTVLDSLSLTVFKSRLKTCLFHTAYYNTK